MRGGGWTLTALAPATVPDRPSGPVSGSAEAPHILTGSRTVALWSPHTGLQRLLAMGAEAARGPRLRSGGAELPGGVSGTMGPGTALRRIPLPGGGELLEQVVFPDTAPGVILHWSLLGGGTAGLSLEVDPGGDGPGVGGLRLTVSRDSPGACWMAPADAPPPLPPDPAIQARRRGSRGSDLDGQPLELRGEGGAAALIGHRLEASIRALDDAPLDEGPDGEPAPPFLLGVDPHGGGDGLLLAGGSALVEIALGALEGGRWGLARAILEEVAQDPSPPALAFLALAGEWGLATGEAGLLRRLRPRLGRALEVALDPGGRPIPPPGAAFPTLPRVLERLADAVEPAGDPAWTADLRGRASRLAAATTSRALPVLGAAPVAPTGEGARDAVLPPVEGFAHPDDPGLLGRRTLHAARLVRALVRGTLGIVPDAAYGRLRVGPDLPGNWPALELRGIRVADARVDLGYRREGDRHTFVLRPTAGRVPLTLILEPSLPVGGVESVELEGERVTVDSMRRGERWGVRFQFPLDGERTVVVVGRASGGGPGGA